MDESLAPASPTEVAFDRNGLVPAVVCQHDTGEVLMLAWMDADALSATLSTRQATFFSRSRQRRWVKGESSGNVQRVVDVRLDCDGDSVLLLVDQGGDGVACHTGERSCFHRRLGASPAGDGGSA